MTDVVSDATTELELFELLSLECRVDETGTLRYYNTHGELHRVHGPAVKYAYGTDVWYQNGQRHRLYGPAVERDDGYRAWYQNGQRHRLDGPAVERPDGRKFWYIDGKELTEAEWQRQVASMQ